MVNNVGFCEKYTILKIKCAKICWSAQIQNYTNNVQSKTQPAACKCIENVFSGSYDQRWKYNLDIFSDITTMKIFWFYK